MKIQSIRNLNFKSQQSNPQKEKEVIKTPAQMAAFLKKKDPIIFDTNITLQIWRQVNPGEEYMRKYMRKRGELHIKKEKAIGEPIVGELKREIDDAKLLLGEFKENSCEINNYFYTQLLKDGLSEYAGKRYGTGLYEIKSPHNPDEIAVLQHNKKKDYFKIIINDKDMNPMRWYFFVNDFYIKNYDPAAGFDYFKSKFGQQSDVELIKDNLLKGLAWIKNSLKKSCKIMTEHPDYKIKLLK